MLNGLTLKQAIDKLQSKEISLDDLYTAIGSSIQEQNEHLNVYLATNTDSRTDAKKQANKPLGGGAHCR